MSKLEARLTRQLASRGVNGARGMAKALLKKRGHITEEGALTPAGKKRQALGAGGRAKDRAAKQSGKPVDSYSYNPKTNRATLKSEQR